MATEVDIQESVCLKKGEREENALTSENFGEKVTELPGNQVKQLEISSLVAEIVNTPLETGKPTDESGTFFQALSDPMVIADDKHSITPESCKAAKQTEPEEETIKNEEKAIESKVCGGVDAPEKAEPQVVDSIVPIKKEELEKNQGDSDGFTSSQDAAFDDIQETATEHATTVTDFIETPREFVKEETVTQKANEQCEIGSKDSKEHTYEESIKKIEHEEESKPDVEMEKREQNGLSQPITSDACISQTITQVETTECEENEQDVNVLEKDQDDDVTHAQEVTLEVGLQGKNHYNEDNEHEVVKAKVSEEEDADVCVSTQTTLVKESIKNEEPDDEKAIEKELCEENGPEKKETLSTVEKDQGDSDGVTISQESPCVDLGETSNAQHVTTEIDFKENDQTEKPREFTQEETEGKSLDAQEASEECKLEELDQNPEASVKIIEKEEETEEIKQGVEIEKKNELLSAITTDVCITTQTKPQVEKTEHEEEDTQNNDRLEEKSDSPLIKECEEKGPEKDEYENVSAIATVTEDKEKEQEVNVLETEEGKDDITSAQDMTCEKNLQEKNHHNEDDEHEVVTFEESIEKDTEVNRSSEKMEQQMLINAIPSDVCISTQTEPEEETAEKNDEEAIERDDCQTNKSEDVTSSENASNEQEKHTEEIKQSVETTEEKDVCISTQIESQEKDAKKEENTIDDDGDLKEKSDSPFFNQVCEENDLKKTEPEEEIKLSEVTTRESVDKATEETKSSDETKENMEPQGVLNVITTDVCSSMQTECIEKTTESEEKKDEGTIDKDDVQREKPEIPLVEVACEATSSEMAESEGVKHSDSSGTTLNENETMLSKEENLEKENEIKTSKVQGGGDDVTSSQNASSGDTKETMIGQHDTSVAYVEEVQGVIAMPKEILIEEAEDKTIDAEELGQPNEQHVEETHPCVSKTMSEDPKDEIKKEDKDLSPESVEDTNDDLTKEEKCTLDQEPVEDHSVQYEVSKEKVIDLIETTEVEPQEDTTPSISLETSTEDTKNLEKENAESVYLPKEDVETVSEVQIPELVPKSEDSMLKEECFISETEAHLDEEKTVTEETDVQVGEDDVTSSQDASNEDIQETTIGQHDTAVIYVEEQGVNATPKEIPTVEAEDKSIDAKELSLELRQPNEQNVEETHPCVSKTISEDPKDEIKKEDKDLSHESVEDTNDYTTKEEKCALEHEPVEVHTGQEEVSGENITDTNETTEVKPQEDIIPSTSFETEASTKDILYSEKEKSESENLPTEDLETVSEVQIPELVLKSEEPVLKEECFISETETHVDEEKRAVTKEISSDEKTEQTTEIKQETVKEVCQETNSEKSELEEGLKLSDSSSMNINEKEITFKNEDEEKDQEVNMSMESKGEDNITSSHIEVSEEKEDFKEKNYHNEGSEGDLIKSGEGVDEDAEEIKPSVNIQANAEPVIGTNVCSSTQIEIHEETMENEEKNGEKAIEYDECETVSREENLEKKQEDVEETKMGEHATAAACFEEVQSLSTETKEVLVKEKEEGDKSGIAQEVTETHDDGENDKREQKPEEQTDEIKQSVETNEEKDVCISTQTESKEEAPKNEGNDIEHDGDLNEKPDNPFVKEVCEENHLTTEVEPQEDITPSISLERSTEDTSNSEKEKAESENLPIEELKTVSEVQIPESVPKSEEAMLKEECFNSEMEAQLHEEKGTTVDEISSDEKTEQTTEIKQETVKEVCEETSSEKVKFEEELQLPDSSDMRINEKEITTFKEDHQENDEREHKPEEHTDEIKPSVETIEEKVVCISTQNESQEEPTKNEENAFERDGDQKENLEIPFVKEVCEESDLIKNESEEGVKHSDSFSTTLNENEPLIKEEKSEKEDTIETSGVQGGGDEVTSSQNASNDDIKETTIDQHDTTMAYVEEGQGVSTMPKEILIEEAVDKLIDVEEISMELGQPNEQNVETHPSLSKSISDNPEDEIKKEDKDLSHESVEDTNGDTTKEEKCTLENEPVEVHSGQDEVSKEKITDLNEITEVEPQKDITPSISLDVSTEDTSNSEKEKAEIEILPTEDVETVSEVQIPESVPKLEELVPKEECLISEIETHLDEEKATITEEISSDEKTEQIPEIKQETIKEVFEETSSDEDEIEEGLELSDTSNMVINEEIATFKDDGQEKDQEVNMSAESQGEDNIKSSHNEVPEEKEELREKNDEGNEGDFIKSGGGVNEDTEEIKSSVETKENTEHVITTNVCSSTQIEPNEETIERSGDKAIESEDNERTSKEENLEKKLEDVCSSAQKEPTENKEKSEEEQEPKVSELQRGADDVVSTKNTSNENTKETVIDQHATTSVHFEEGMGVNAIKKEITGEEVEDKSIHAQEASEHCENGAEDKIEQQPAESVNKPVNTCSETNEEIIKEEEEADAGNKKIESEQETENQADKTEDSTEMKDEAVLTEKVPNELGQTKEQNVKETEASFNETTSEKTEHMITKDEDLSHDSIEHINESTTIEEKCFPDGTTKEIEISTLEHESIEKQNESQDEVPKGKATDLREPTVVEPQEHIMPSSFLGTSAKDTSDSDKAKANLETHGSTQQPENSYSTTEEHRDIKEDVTQENQLASNVDCSGRENDVILAKEVPLKKEKEKGKNDSKEQILEKDSYSPELEEKPAQKENAHEKPNSDSVPAEDPEVAEVTVESVDLSNIESTAYPSESEKLATRALESDCYVQIPEVVPAEDSKVKEECIVLAAAEYTDENNVEEQDTKTNKISVAPDKEQTDVTKAPTESDEAESSNVIIEAKALTKENLEVHGEPEPASELVIKEDQVTMESKPQAEQSDIVSENTTNDQTLESKLEHTSGKRHMEDDVTLATENETKNIENLNETTKNIILTDEVAVVTEKEQNRNGIEGQVSEEDNCTEALDSTSTPDQKELANEIEYSNPIALVNTEVTEVKAESQVEVENIYAAEDLSCLSKASSIIDTSKVEMHENTEQAITVIEEVKDDSIDEASKYKIVPVLEDSKGSDPQVNLSEIESTDTPLNGQENIEEKSVLAAQLTDKDILEEKDDKLISESQTFSEDQKMISERCIEEEAQSNFNAEIKDAKNEAAEAVIINEVLLEDKKAKESKLDQLTSDTDVCQIERSSSKPDEVLETKASVEGTEDVKFMADSLSVKDETITVIEGSNEDSEIVASEFKRLEDKVADKEKETVDEPQAADSEKTTYDSVLSSTEQDTIADSDISTEVAEIVPESKKDSAISADDLPVASPEMLPAKHEEKITEELDILSSVEKDVIDVQKHEKDLGHESDITLADVVSNVECSEIEQLHLNKKEATSEFINQEQEKEADESIKDVIPVEDVKTSTREGEVEVGSVDCEVPSIMDATANKEVHETVEGLLKDDEHLESTCGQSKPIEECSEMKQEPLKLDASGTLGTTTTEDLTISQKCVADDLIKASQTHPKIPKYKEKSESLEPAEIVLHEPARGNTEMSENLQVEKEETGAKTDEEEEADNEDDEKMGSGSDAPVMVEASKDIEVKAHKKSHNILSGVGSKVKHSIAKVKKAITGKPSPTKSSSPKAKSEVAG